MQHIIGSDIDYAEALDALPDDTELTKQERVDIALGKHKSGWSCDWAPDGSSVACGPSEPRRPREQTWDEVMATRQQVAGEEDQSVSAGDEGA